MYLRKQFPTNENEIWVWSFASHHGLTSVKVMCDAVKLLKMCLS